MTLAETHPNYFEKLLQHVTKKLQLSNVEILDTEEQMQEEIITLSAKYKGTEREIILKCYDTFTTVTVVYAQYNQLVGITHNLESSDGKQYFHWEHSTLKMSRNIPRAEADAKEQAPLSDIRKLAREVMKLEEVN